MLIQSQIAISMLLDLMQLVIAVFLMLNLQKVLFLELQLFLIQWIIIQNIYVSMLMIKLRIKLIIDSRILLISIK